MRFVRHRVRIRRRRARSTQTLSDAVLVRREPGELLAVRRNLRMGPRQDFRKEFRAGSAGGKFRAGRLVRHEKRED